MSLPRIGLCLGDPGGIGPEITLKALHEKQSLPLAEYRLFAPFDLLEFWAVKLGLNLEQLLNPSPQQWGGKIIVSPFNPRFPDFTIGQPSKANGLFSFSVFQSAIKIAEKGELEAVVTGPISKYSWAMAKIPWKGHTEYLNQSYPQAIMSFWSQSLKVALFTHHLPLAQVSPLITKENLLNFFQSLYQAINKTSVTIDEYLVAGFNPHAGEEGLLGQEEGTQIIPAVRAAQQAGLPIHGPFPPDTLFHQALDREKKMVIALYHDQGLIAFKLVAFTSGVNVTLGLPFIRTSPDHGTAFDIAGQGKAEATSMKEAIRWAFRFWSPPP